ASRRWQPEEEVPEPPGETEPSAELAAFQSIGRQSMLDLIEDLSQEQKQVLRLKFAFNLPNCGVATIRGKTEGAMKSRERRAADDLETLRLELLVADRDHVERRLDRIAKQAKSGDLKLKQEVSELERVLAHVDAGGTLAEWPGVLPEGLEPLTTKPLLAVENG